MVEKKNSTAMQHITHLSHPQGLSINSFIAPEDAETHYQSFETAVQLVACQGQGSYMVKEDFKSAFMNVLMHYEDLNLLGIKVQGKFFIACIPLFGATVEFFGLTLDTNFMVICIPQYKLTDITQIINKMIKQRKATGWELQSLA